MLDAVEEPLDPAGLGLGLGLRDLLGQREPAPAPPWAAETFDRAFAILRCRQAERDDGPRPAVAAN